LLVNPRSVEDIASAMSRLLNDSALHTSLLKKGLEHARMFTWHKSGEQHFAVFKDVLSARMVNE